MNIAWLRDLTIVIWGLISMVVTIMLGVIAFAIFRRLKTILGSAEVASANIAELSVLARESAGPILRITGIIQVVAKTMEAIRGLAKNKKEGNNG
jgi:hypothetical protein